MSAAANRPRAVVLVANAANPYSRGLRVARSLAAAGFDVEIAATTGEAAPVEEATAPHEPPGRPRTRDRGLQGGGKGRADAGHSSLSGPVRHS